jgi:hypothetical protein
MRNEGSFVQIGCEMTMLWPFLCQAINQSIYDVSTLEMTTSASLVSGRWRQYHDAHGDLRSSSPGVRWLHPYPITASNSRKRSNSTGQQSKICFRTLPCPLLKIGKSDPIMPPWGVLWRSRDHIFMVKRLERMTQTSRKLTPISLNCP